jgi:hypothetical protein
MPFTPQPQVPLSLPFPQPMMQTPVFNNQLQLPFLQANSMLMMPALNMMNMNLMSPVNAMRMRMMPTMVAHNPMNMSRPNSAIIPRGVQPVHAGGPSRTASRGQHSYHPYSR